MRDYRSIKKARWLIINRLWNREYQQSSESILKEEWAWFWEQDGERNHLVP